MRIAQGCHFPGRVSKDQNRAKRFDKAPRFTLNDSSVSVHKQLIQTTGNPNDHKSTSDFHIHAVALSACFFFTTSFGSSCRYSGSHCLLTATRLSRTRRRDRIVSIRQDRAVGDAAY